jgi:hypothetical protein
LDDLALGHVPDGPEGVAVSRRHLEVLLVRGGLHLGLEARFELLVPALQEEDDVGDRLRVGLAGREPGDTGTEAGMEVVVQAGPGQLPVDLDRAGADLKVPRDHPHDPPCEPSPEGTEIGVAVVLHAARHQGARPGLARRDLDVGVGLVVAEADVVAGAMLLDQGVLEQQRLEVRVRDDRLDVLVGAEQGGRLGIEVLAEIGGDPFADRAGLAHVEKAPSRPSEQVDARTVGQALGGPALHAHRASLTPV